MIDDDTAVAHDVTVPPAPDRAFAPSTERTPGTTRVDLVHRDLERFGDAAATIRDVFRSPGGWPGILAGFEARARS